MVTAPPSFVALGGRFLCYHSFDSSFSSDLNYLALNLREPKWEKLKLNRQKGPSWVWKAKKGTNDYEAQKRRLSQGSCQARRERTLRSLRGSGDCSNGDSRRQLPQALPLPTRSRMLTHVQILSLPGVLGVSPGRSSAHKTLFHIGIHSVAAIHIFVYGFDTKRFPLYL